MDFIFEIHLLASTLAFLGMLLVAAKWITKRLAPKKADSFFLKLHKTVGYLTAIARITHMVCAVRAIAVTPVWVYIFGRRERKKHPIHHELGAFHMASSSEIDTA